MILARFIARRLVGMVGVLLALAAVMFILQKLTRVDPVRAMLGPNAPPSAVAIERHRLGYDQPLVVQYLRYINDLLHGNLQMSLRTRRPVRTDLATFLPATAELAAVALMMSLIGGGILGVLTALRFRVAQVFRLVLVLGASTPSFLFAQLGLLIFYHRLHWLPATGQVDNDLSNVPNGPTHFLVIDSLLHAQVGVAWNAILHLILPASCVAILAAVAIARVLRSSLVETLQSDFIRTARSKGLSEFLVIWRHALRNAVGPAISMAGLQLGLMFAGVVVVEQIFAWPGIGNYVAESIPATDFPAIAGVTMVLGAAYVIINTTVDILHAVADPRIEL
jgi:peptide/nickel transport system permease protein